MSSKDRQPYYADGRAVFVAPKTNPTTGAISMGFCVCEADTPENAAEIANRLCDADRYRYLRSRDLNTIDQGGIFAGTVPDNTVMNGRDLDAAIDAAMVPGKAGRLTSGLLDERQLLLAEAEASLLSARDDLRTVAGLDRFINSGEAIDQGDADTLEAIANEIEEQAGDVHQILHHSCQAATDTGSAIGTGLSSEAVKGSAPHVK
ncbi:hypothetical protein [Ferrovibrio terrae]|uniref:hypothetical protein n=1 Tax=Ferrovibrio terrae TaxID=2594003 RepID=UPI003137C32A